MNIIEFDHLYDNRAETNHWTEIWQNPESTIRVTIGECHPDRGYGYDKHMVMIYVKRRIDGYWDWRNVGYPEFFTTYEKAKAYMCGLSPERIKRGYSLESDMRSRLDILDEEKHSYILMVLDEIFD